MSVISVMILGTLYFGFVVYNMYNTVLIVMSGGRMFGRRKRAKEFPPPSKYEIRKSEEARVIAVMRLERMGLNYGPESATSTAFPEEG